jgi:hypothetical protein
MSRPKACRNAAAAYDKDWGNTHALYPHQNRKPVKHRSIAVRFTQTVDSGSARIGSSGAFPVTKCISTNGARGCDETMFPRGPAASV